jgi:hypothetical protein
VLFPAGKVSDVGLAPQQTSPSFRSLHHGVIYAHRKENDLLACAAPAMTPSDKISNNLSRRQDACDVARRHATVQPDPSW